MINGAILQENLTLINTYAPSNREPKYTKPLLIELKEETDKNAE